jgi:predicted HicB family RNase H-like nuclease
MEKKAIKRAQIAFDVDAELRADIKIRAAKRNISMNLWIMRAIYQAIRKEDQYKSGGGEEK